MQTSEPEWIHLNLRFFARILAYSIVDHGQPYFLHEVVRPRTNHFCTRVV